MMMCGRGECQTTAGCAHRGPKGELCHFSDLGSYRNTPGWLHVEVRPLHAFSDDEIAAEYHRRMLRKLGDQSKCVTLPILYD